MGKILKIKSEEEVRQEDIEGVDLVVSMGKFIDHVDNSLLRWGSYFLASECSDLGSKGTHFGSQYISNYVRGCS